MIVSPLAKSLSIRNVTSTLFDAPIVCVEAKMLFDINVGDTTAIVNTDIMLGAIFPAANVPSTVTEGAACALAEFIEVILNEMSCPAIFGPLALSISVPVLCIQPAGL